MTITTLARRAGQWALRRARERSTWTGLAMLATALGFRELGGRIDDVADALTLIGLASGAGLAAATTSQHPSEDQ